MATLFCDPANRNAIRSGRGRPSRLALPQAPASASASIASTSAIITAQSAGANMVASPCSTAPENAT
jgi:hypothetical protein